MSYNTAQQAEILGVPAPDTTETQVSNQLVRKICGAAKGLPDGLPFADFMRMALYDPELGYYSAGKHKFGEGGDFVTAPEMGSAFAYCIADQLEQILQDLGGGSILEAGAGRGILAADILLELEHRDCLPENYLILELAHGLRTIQRETLEQKTPHLLGRVQWLDRLPEHLEGVVLGNELLDAMPMVLFEIQQQEPVAINIVCKDGAPAFQVGGQLPEKIIERLREVDLPTGYRSEINQQAEAWIASVADCLERGVMLLIDYGFPRAEYFHPQRKTGTLMCHYRHHNHGDPLSLIGLQDITAHVDFTAMAEAAVDNGLEVLGYTSQAAFLVASGMEQLMASSNPENAADHLALTNQINKLTHPAEMGELFKVIALGKGIEQPLKGFVLQDRRHRL